MRGGLFREAAAGLTVFGEGLDLQRQVDVEVFRLVEDQTQRPYATVGAPVDAAASIQTVD